MAANGARGEAVAVLAGAERRLCLTLGALAELETAFGLSGWEALSERLRNLSPGDLLIVLAALLRGGGEGEAAAACCPSCRWISARRRRPWRRRLRRRGA